MNTNTTSAADIRQQIEKAVALTEIDVSLSWGDRDGKPCPRCGAGVIADDRATVECTGSKIRGCVQCVGPIVASYCTAFRTNVLKDVVTELAAAKKERATNTIKWADAEVKRLADKAAREVAAEQESARRR
jgi:hypothetical protein